MQANWFRITNETEVPSPSLLIFPERIEEKQLATDCPVPPLIGWHAEELIPKANPR